MRRAVLSLLALVAMTGATMAQPAVGAPPAKAAPKTTAKVAAKAAPAPAAAAAAGGPKLFGVFAVRCAKGKNVMPCDLYEERFDKSTGQRVIGFSIGYMPSSNRYIMQVVGPLGVAVDQGVTITDGKFTTPVLPYRRCDSTGCFVEVAIDKSLIDAFSKMGDAKIRVIAYGGKPYNFTFSFDGFADAHAEMVAENKAKATTTDN